MVSPPPFNSSVAMGPKTSRCCVAGHAVPRAPHSDAGPAPDAFGRESYGVQYPWTGEISGCEPCGRPTSWATGITIPMNFSMASSDSHRL